MGTRHHFVPQFLLRRFTDDPDHRRISVIRCSDSAIYRDVSLRDQAYKRRLYGAGDDLERLLATVENHAASALANLSGGAKPRDLAHQAEVALLTFAFLQISRTPSSWRETRYQLQDMVAAAVDGAPNRRAVLEKFRLATTITQELLVRIALESVEVVSDMGVSFLQTDSATPLVLGDHPAVVVNPYLSFHHWPGSSAGVGNTGAVIVLPVATSELLVVYDRQCYGVPRGAGVHADDVTAINRLQFCYADGCTYFCNRIRDLELRDWCSSTEEFRLGKKHVLSKYRPPGGRRARSEILMASGKDPPVEARFSFVGFRQWALEHAPGPTMDISRPNVRGLRERMGLNRPHGVQL